MHYFPSPNIGWTAEIGYLGLGTKDRCTAVEGPRTEINRRACIDIDGKERSASAVAGMAGLILRANSRGDVQPYVRASAGLALVPRSTTAMIAFFPDPLTEDDRALIVYSEDGSRAAKPVVSAGFGFATSPRRGYQFRFEARYLGVQLATVEGPTDGTQLVPPIANTWVFLPSLTLGIDVVLEKRRGRRY
jgi:hypothetical protein